MSLAASPARLGVAAVATSIAVLATSCGSEPDEVADGEAEEGSTDEPEGAPSLSEPGILGADCFEGSLVASLFSDESGEEITSYTFSPEELTGAEVPDFPAGRATDADRVSLPMCSTESVFGPSDVEQFLIPEFGVLLVTVREEVEGTEAETVGVLDSEGNVSVLTEEQDVGDFDDPAEWDTGRYDAAQNRILYLEPLDSETTPGGVQSASGLFHQIDLDSGETMEAFVCTVVCRSLWIEQDSGLLSWVTFPPRDVLGLITSPDGSIVVERDSNTFWNVDNPTEATVVNSDRDDPIPDEGSLDVWDSYFQGPLAVGEIVEFISDTEIILSDNELSVIEVGESEIGPLDEDEATLSEEIPVSYSLVPDGPRDNGTPVLSPDLDEAVFVSTADSGEASWYRVPTDGSADPTEIGPVTEEAEGFALVSWT